MRTSVKPREAVPSTVTLRPLVKLYGTSTPCTLWPSLRMYSTLYCVRVMKLFADGLSSTSFICSCTTALPTSLKIEPLSLTTSDLTVTLGGDPPVRLIMIRYEDPCPVRIASLHDGRHTAQSSTSATLTRPVHTTLR